MQVDPFRQKMQREHQIIIKELSKFRNSWQGKVLTPQKIETYCNLVTYVSDLHSSYVFNCMEYFTPAMKQETFTISRNIVEDLVKKLKQFQVPLDHDNSSLKSKQIKQTCHICASKIRQIDVKLLKEQLADDASLRKSLLRNLYTDLENQNAALFTKDQDEVFFQFLNRILIKKEEVLAMQTKQINDFLMGVTKSFSDLNFLTEYTPVKLSSSDYKENYQEDMQKTIVNSLKTGFNGKIHPWVEKVFDSMKRNILQQKRLNLTDESQQTCPDLQPDYDRKRSEYAASLQSRKELQQLKEEVEKHVQTIEELKCEITVLRKQKRELEEYYMKEVAELIAGRKNAEMELKKMQTELSSMKMLKKSELFQMNKKLGKQTKKTESDAGTAENKDDNENVDLNNELSKSLIKQPKENPLQTSTHLKKKKIGLARIISKRSDVQKFIPSNQQRSVKYLNDVHETKLNISNNNQNNYEATGQQLTTQKNISSANNNNKSTEEFLKEINLKSSQKRLKSGTDRKQEEPNHKVEFKLDLQNDRREHTQHTEGIDTIVEQAYTNRAEIDGISVGVGSVAKINRKKKTSSKKIKNQGKEKKTGRKNQRLLSIEMKISPFQTKARQSSHKPKTQNINPVQTNEAQIQSPVTKPSLTSKKKVFQFVPLQNKQQYEELKQKMNELTSRIELRNSEKHKQSIKNIRDESGIQMPKLYGFTIFSKKISEVFKEGEKSQRSKNKSMETKRSKVDSDDQGDTELKDSLTIGKMQKGKRSKSKSSRYRVLSKKLKSVRKIDFSQQTQTPTQTPSLIDHIHTLQRQELYNKLNKESVIPPQLSFHHYEMIVRKLFAEQKNSQPFGQIVNHRLLKSRISTNGNEDLLKKSRQKESVKINIDARFFEDVKPIKTHSTNQVANPTNNNGKLLLNLPKLSHSPSTNLPTQQNRTSLNNTSNSQLLDDSKRKKSMFHTLREGKTKIKDESLVNIRQSFTKIDKVPMDQSCVVKEENELGTTEALLSPIIESSNTTSNTTTPMSVTLHGKGSHHPSSLLQPINPKTSNIFTPNDIKLLFESQLSAYEYEQLTKTALHSHTQEVSFKMCTLTEGDQELIKSLYSILMQIKQKNQEMYYKVCSFVKQPFQSVRSGFEFINTVKELSLEAWTQYLVKIYSLRKGDVQRLSSNKQNHLTGRYQRLSNSNLNTLNFAAFLKPFEDKLVQCLVTGVK